MVNIVRINVDTKMNDLELNMENCNVISTLNKTSKQKGKNNIRHLYSWTHNSDIIKCYGWYDGEHNIVNKHELIPNGSSKFLDDDSSTILLYGDIFLLCNDKNNKLKDFSVSDYAEFYDIINEGFDDCITDDDDDDSDESEFEENNEDDEDTDYNEDDMEGDFELINSDESDELDIDNNKY